MLQVKENVKFFALSLLCWWLHLAPATGTDLKRLARCLGDERTTYGYTYDLREGKRWWSHCGFPSPVVEQSLCGRPLNFTHKYWLCDPDQLLTRQEAFDVDRKLYVAKRVTPYQCKDTWQRWENYTIGVVLIDKLRVADLASPELCLNLCHELLPEVNYTARAPTQEELDTTAQNFADNLLRTWRLGSCDNDVVIFYSQQYHLLATAVGDKASDSLSPSFIKSTQKAVTGYFRDGDHKTGLLVLIQAYQSRLQGFTPAHVMLVLNFVLMALVLCFFGYQYTLGYDVGEAYSDTILRKGLRRITYLLMGLYLVEGVLMFMAWISEKWKALTLLGILGAITVIFLVLGLSASSQFKPSVKINGTTI